MIFFSIGVVGNNNELIASSTCTSNLGRTTLSIHSMSSCFSSLVVYGNAVQADLIGPLGHIIKTFTDIQALVSHSPDCSYVLCLPISGGSVAGTLILGFVSPPGISARRIRGLTLLCNFLSDSLAVPATELICNVEQLLGKHLGCSCCMTVENSPVDDNSRPVLSLSDYVNDEDLWEDSEEESMDSDSDGFNAEEDSGHSISTDIRLRNSILPGDVSKMSMGSTSSVLAFKKGFHEYSASHSNEEEKTHKSPSLDIEHKSSNIQHFQFSKAALMDAHEAEHIESLIHPIWMSFQSSFIEADFKHWHNKQMMPLENVVSIFLCIMMVFLWSQSILSFPVDYTSFLDESTFFWMLSLSFLVLSDLKNKDNIITKRTALRGSRTAYVSYAFALILQIFMVGGCKISDDMSAASCMLGSRLVKHAMNMMLAPIFGLKIGQKFYISLISLYVCVAYLVSSIDFLTLPVIALNALMLRSLEMRNRRIFAYKLKHESAVH